MLIAIIMQIGVLFVSMLVGWIPRVHALPFGMDDALAYAMGVWYSFVHSVWMLQLPWNLFLWYMYIRIGLYGLKLFLGHRLPLNA